VASLKRAAAEPAKAAAKAAVKSPAPRRGAAGRMQAALATAFDADEEWKEF
jgi:hypothetical protein